MAKVDAIIAAMREVPGVYLLDRESDADHNRSVVTIAGEPDAVAEAALRGVGKAAELIDLTKHSGAHPRMGATDVVPFIPVEGVSIEDCVALAKKVGREIWERYHIPVYFYEAAAQRPERSNLENIRKGQFEGLLAEVPKNPDRAPDIGEQRLHPTAGATVVGARKFLVAYNINLNTPDLEIAKKIGKNIRFSNGGLRYVKAMGVDLARAQSRASLHQHDGLRADAAASRLRNGEARSRTLRRLHRRQRNRRPDSQARHRTDRRFLSATGELFARASV